MAGTTANIKDKIAYSALLRKSPRVMTTAAPANAKPIPVHFIAPIRSRKSVARKSVVMMGLSTVNSAARPAGMRANAAKKHVLRMAIAKRSVAAAMRLTSGARVLLPMNVPPHIKAISGTSP